MSLWFRVQTAPGAAALQLWLLHGDEAELHAAIGAAEPVDSLPRLRRIHAADGSVLDEVLVRAPAPGQIELCLHGGLGVARAMREHLIACGGVEESRRVSAIEAARTPLGARLAWAHAHPPSPHPWQEADPSERSVEFAQQLVQMRDWALLARGEAQLALAGLPNAGKSSLMNAWLRERRVTVSPHPGTTRDAVEAAVLWGDGVDACELQLVDTAGLWSEAVGSDARAVERSRRVIAKAWRVLWVLDGSRAPTADVADWALAQPQDLLVVSHADREPDPAADDAQRVFPGCLVGRFSLTEDPSAAVAACSAALRASLSKPPPPGSWFPLDSATWAELEAVAGARD